MCVNSASIFCWAFFSKLRKPTTSVKLTAIIALLTGGIGINIESVVLFPFLVSTIFESHLILKRTVRRTKDKTNEWINRRKRIFSKFKKSFKKKLRNIPLLSFDDGEQLTKNKNEATPSNNEIESFYSHLASKIPDRQAGQDRTTQYYEWTIYQNCFSTSWCWSTFALECIHIC